MMTQQGWGLSLFAIFLAAFFLLLVVGTPGCSRPLPAEGRDASATAPDGGAPTIEIDAASEHAPAACPAGAPTLDVCGCGCCSPAPLSTACYYPARGESVATIPNPRPSAEACAMAGCSTGIRHVCCADPGPVAGGTATYCAEDMATSLDRFTVLKRQGDICTSFLLEGLTSPYDLPLTTPPSFGVSQARRAPCQNAAAGKIPIGGLGEIRFGRSDQLGLLIDAHVALFFVDESGSVTAERFDIDGLDITGDPCPR